MPSFRDEPTFTQTYEATIWLPRFHTPIWAMSIPRRSLSPELQEFEDADREFDVLRELLEVDATVVVPRERIRAAGRPPESATADVLQALIPSSLLGRELARQAWIPLERSPVSGASVATAVSGAAVIGIATLGGQPIVILVGAFGWLLMRGLRGAGTGLEEASRASIRHLVFEALNIPAEARTERLREFPPDSADDGPTGGSPVNGPADAG